MITLIPKGKKVIIFYGKTHVLSLIALFLLLKDRILIDRPIGIIILFLSLGAVLPDIDHPNSFIGKFFVPVSAVVKHRNGYTHSLMGSFLFTLPILLMSKYYYFVTVIGYLFHLVEDTLTPSGIKWLFPIKKKSYSLKVAKTGGLEELFILGLSLLYIFKGTF